MPKIERIEIFQVDLDPPVPRSDAIQTFSVQETPMMRVFCDDGSSGTGYSYTIGNGASSIIAMLRDHMAPRLIGEILRTWRRSGRIYSSSRTRTPLAPPLASRFAWWTRHYGTCVAAERICLCMSWRWRAQESPGLRYGRRLVASDTRSGPRQRSGKQGERLPRCQDKSRAAPRIGGHETPGGRAQGPGRRF